MGQYSTLNSTKFLCRRNYRLMPEIRQEPLALPTPATSTETAAAKTPGFSTLEKRRRTDYLELRAMRVQECIYIGCFDEGVS